MTSPSPSPVSLREYADRIEADLRQNVLPFWMLYVVDKTRGGFFGALTNERVVDRAAGRGALLTCRILWTFSAVFRRYGDPACLAMADRAYEDLQLRFRDAEHGGLYWSIASDGTPQETRKQVYGQAFGVYALSEYHRASGRREALDEAIAVFRLIEDRARDRVSGGYFEAFARDWSPIEDVRLSAVDLNAPKSQNTHLHVMEAYTNLLRVWPDPALRDAQAALVDVMLTRILDPVTSHLALFFSADWGRRSDAISYGHDIEASWLLTEAAREVGDAALIERSTRAALGIARVTLSQGVDTDGAIVNAGGPEGVTDFEKEWWPQAEAVVGFLEAYRLDRDERYLTAALKTWDFIEQRLIDRTNGEWFRGVTRDGTVLPDHLKVSFWKCPYHNGRAALEASVRLRAIAAEKSQG